MKSVGRGFYHVLHRLKTPDEPFYCFLKGGAGVGKSLVTKASYQAASKCKLSPVWSIGDNDFLCIIPWACWYYHTLYGVGSLSSVLFNCMNLLRYAVSHSRSSMLYQADNFA